MTIEKTGDKAAQRAERFLTEDSLSQGGATGPGAESEWRGQEAASRTGGDKIPAECPVSAVDAWLPLLSIPTQGSKLVQTLGVVFSFTCHDRDPDTARRPAQKSCQATPAFLAFAGFLTNPYSSRK